MEWKLYFALMQFYFLGTAPFMQDTGIPAKNVPASMGLAQAVQAIATVGLFLGTQFAGVIMDKFRKDDKFQWRSIFIVPCAIAFIAILVLVIFLKG